MSAEDCLSLDHRAETVLDKWTDEPCDSPLSGYMCRSTTGVPQREAAGLFKLYITTAVRILAHRCIKLNRHSVADG